MRSRLVAVVLLSAWAACLGTGAGCYQPSVTASGWVAGQMQAITTTSTASQAAGPGLATAPVELVGCGNETLAFQVVADVGPRGGALELKWSDLTSDQGVPLTGGLEAYRALPVRVEAVDEGYVRLHGPAPLAGQDIYDALSPLGAGATIQAGPGQRLVYWIDLPLGPDTMPGYYRGTLSLVGAGKPLWSVALSVTVLDAVLPELPSLRACGGYAHWQVFAALVRRGGQPLVPVRLDRTQESVRAGLTLMRELERLGRRHRLDLFDDELRPLLKRDLSGAIRLDWDDYDAIALPYLDGSAFDDARPVEAWPMPVGDDWPAPQRYGGLGSPEHRDVLGQILDRCREHFDGLPAAAGRVFVWPMRQGPSAAAYGEMATLADVVRAHAGGYPLLSRLPPAPPPATLWPAVLTGRVDMAAPPGLFFAPGAPGLAASASPLAGQWLTPGQPPAMPALGLLAEPASVRALPWLAHTYAAAGLFIPRVLDWRGAPMTYRPGQAPQLFYPQPDATTPAILPSAQLKRLRRGLEDLGYLRLLEARGRGDVAAGVSAVLARYAGQAGAVDNYLDVRLDGWCRSPAVWEAAHDLLAQELASAVQQQDQPGLSAARSRWAQIARNEQPLAAQRVRTLVAPQGHRQAVRVSVDLQNNWPADAAVVLTLDQVPPGWEPVRQVDRLMPMPAAGAATAHLEATFTDFPITDTGKVLLPITLEARSQAPVVLEAAVCQVLAPWTDRPPAIDGHLDDWTLRAANTAGDFRQLAQLDAPLSAPARQPTRVHLVRDAGYLYLAIRCEQEDMSALVARQDNQVRYQGLAAWGEDLVEVVLDPGRRASGPQDLYHLVVKSNGIVQVTRGIEITPPLGPVQPWPAQIRSAVGQAGGEWIVELAIRLEALGPGAAADVWGADFARFCAADRQSSNWTGAQRNIYDPSALGTLVLQGPPASAPTPRLGRQASQPATMAP